MAIVCVQDLSNNMLTFGMCMQLEQAARTVQLGSPEFKLVLKGNRVLDEVLNSSSHFIGFIMAIVGAIFMVAARAITTLDHMHDGAVYMHAASAPPPIIMARDHSRRVGHRCRRVITSPELTLPRLTLVGSCRRRVQQRMG